MDVKGTTWKRFDWSKEDEDEVGEEENKCEEDADVTTPVDAWAKLMEERMDGATVGSKKGASRAGATEECVADADRGTPEAGGDEEETAAMTSSVVNRRREVVSFSEPRPLSDWARI